MKLINLGFGLTSLLLSLFFATSFGESLNNYRLLNTGIFYLPWRECSVAQKYPANDEQAGPCDTPIAPMPAGMQPYSRNEGIRIQPGMKISIHSINLVPVDKESIVPTISEYRWVVPSNGLVSKDFLLFNQYLGRIAYSPSHPEIHFIKELKTWKKEWKAVNKALLEADQKEKNPGKRLGEKKFYEDINREVYKPIISSLMFYLPGKEAHGIQLPECKDADCLRQTLATPGVTMFDESDDVSTSAVLASDVTFITGKPIRINYLRSMGGFYSGMSLLRESHSSYGGIFDDELVQAESVGKSKREIISGNTHVELEIPIIFKDSMRVNDAETQISEYFPIYFSVKDLENRLQKKILGVFRDVQYDGSLRKAGIMTTLPERSLVPFLIDFDVNWFDGVPIDGVRFKVKKENVESWKAKIQLAAGDVVVLGESLCVKNCNKFFDNPGSR